MILITGATGNNGQEIVRLLSRTGVPCRALVRSNEKAGSLSDLPGVALVYGDFARLDSLTASLEGVDRALLISSIDPKLPELAFRRQFPRVEFQVDYVARSVVRESQ